MNSGSYTYCTRCYRTFQFAYTSCGSCMDSYVRMMYRTVQGGGLQKFHVHQTRPHDVLNWHARCQIHTSNVRGATAPPSLYVQLMEPIRCRMSGCCTEPYCGCTKTPFAHDQTPWLPDRTGTAQGATGSSSLRIHLVAPAWILLRML